MQRNRNSFVIHFILLSILFLSCSKETEFCSNAPEVTEIMVDMSFTDFYKTLKIYNPWLIDDEISVRGDDFYVISLPENTSDNKGGESQESSKM